MAWIPSLPAISSASSTSTLENVSIFFRINIYDSYFQKDNFSNKFFWHFFKNWCNHSAWWTPSSKKINAYENILNQMPNYLYSLYYISFILSYLCNSRIVFAEGRNRCHHFTLNKNEGKLRLIFTRTEWYQKNDWT